MNILLIVNELNYSCGVTNHILHLTRGLISSGMAKPWIICGGGNGINRFRDIDVDIISDERFLHSGRTFSGFISAIRFLVKFTRDNGIDVIHSHSHYGASIGKRTSMLTGTATVQTNHGLLKNMGRLKHFNADKYVAINEHILKYILENKIAKPDNVIFIRCGIPVEKEIPPKPSGGKLKVLAASRFVHEKGLDIFIHAVNKLPQDVLDKADFVIAGEGELDDKLAELNRSLGSKITFAGRITEIGSYLLKTHILVNPSRSDTEGFPALITEAGAASALVISSDFKGAEDVLKDGINSLIYRDHSSDKLSALLTEAVNNYDKYIPLAAEFHRMIYKEFSILPMIEKHIYLYRTCRKK